MNRLKDIPTLKIRPDRRLEFTYQDRRMVGCEGDTVASALFANGVRIFSRSIKYHRPRGLYSLDGESANTLLEIDGLANCRSETTFLRAGMNVQPQNCMGSPEHDWMSVLDKFGFAMPAGFFYRVFHKPYRLWPFFQNRLRAAAGIGVLRDQVPAGRCDEAYLHAEVCVLGGGPAGLTAALAAAQTDRRVVLLEARPWLGGFYDWRGAIVGGSPLYERGAALVDRVRADDRIRVLTRASVNGLWGDNLVTAFVVGGPTDTFDERYVEVRAAAVVVATGAAERPLVFEHNERPGVMQPLCAHRLARTWGLTPGRRAVFSVGHDLGLEAAADLHDLGLEIAVVADCRMDGMDPDLLMRLADRRIPFLLGWSACRTKGDRQVRGAVLASLRSPEKRDFECDILAVSPGLSPNAGPLYTAQAKMAFDEYSGMFLPEKLPPRVHAAGRVLGLQDPESIEASGRLAGLKAASDTGADVSAAIRQAEDDSAGLPGPARGSRLAAAPRLGRGEKSFVCFDEDVTYKHIRQAYETGFDQAELVKRYTAAGTGPGQGGIPGHNLPLLIAELRAPSPSIVQPTTVRPPLVPTRLTTYAGLNHDLCRRTPLQEDQEKLGGVFRRIGAWRRARYFSSDFTCREEVRNVRENVGVIDVSTLGKFRIFGPDALKALDRVYVGDMKSIPAGRVKYAAMVQEDGCLVDDGVITKLGENDYYFTTSTGRAAMTAEWFRYHCKGEGWDFHIVNLTDQLGAINIAGPQARRVLAELTDDDVSTEAFPFLAYREIILMDAIPARAMRLGFVGELSFELHLPASYLQTVWARVFEVGREFGIRPFGVEAQSIMRLEKGHVIIGQESEIRTTLHDLGLGALWCRHKPEAKTVGAAALRLTEHQRGRLKLVGIRVDDGQGIPGDGAVIVDSNIRGYVCTVRQSVSLGCAVGLALVDEDLAAFGTELKIFQMGLGDGRIAARVVSRPFYDPEGRRMKM